VNELHLFAGAGGGILGGQLLGHTTVCAVEIEKYPRQVLLQRQRDGILPKFPIWDDVCTFDGRPWRGTVDVLAGGFPCQDISAAGKGAGIAGARSGLWKEYARIIDEIRPRFVFAENSPLLRTRGLGVVLEDLAALGYDARWCVLGARDVGAPHKRDRMWVLAYADNDGQAATKESGSTTQGSYSSTSRKKSSSKSAGLRTSRANESVANAMQKGLQRDKCTRRTYPQGRQESNGSTFECSSLWWQQDPADLPDSEVLYAQGRADESGEIKLRGSNKRKRANDENRPTESLVGRVANGVANRVDRLKAIGNGQVPQCAAMAFRILSQGLT